jgi:hypothetical protein
LLPEAHLEVRMAVAAFGSNQVQAFTALRVQIADGSMEPDFPCGLVAIVIPDPLRLEPGVAVCVELPDGAQVIRWFIRSLEYGSFLLAANPFLCKSRLWITPRNSRVIGVVLDLESIVCESEISNRD